MKLRTAYNETVKMWEIVSTDASSSHKWWPLAIPLYMRTYTAAVKYIVQFEQKRKPGCSS